MIIRATSNTLTAIVSTIVVLSVVATSAMGGQISIDPVDGITVSSETGTRPSSSLVDGSGLSGGLHGTNPAEMWLSLNGDTAGFLVFDFGAIYSVTNIHVWNFNQAVAGFTNRGVNTVLVKYGTNLTFGFDSAFESTLTEVTNFAKASGAAGEPGEAFDSFAAFEARYVLFDIIANHGGPYAGMSEVQFSGTFVQNYDPTPEITNVTVESVSTEWGGRLAANTLDDTGLNILGQHTTDPNSGMWMSDSETLPEIVYDLGATYNVETVEVWNWNFASALSRGIDGVDISGSTDGTNFSAIVSSNFAIGPGNSTDDFSEIVPVTATARYVKLDVTSNHGDGSFTGLSEIKFYGELQAASSPGTLFIFQ